MLRQLLVTALLAHSAFGAGPQAGQIKNLVTFGDSYTDVVGSILVLSEQQRQQ